MKNLNKIELTDEKKAEIESFLKSRFTYLRDLREQFDTEIKKEVDIWDNIDEESDDKPDWQEKYNFPSVYTIGQRIASRIVRGLFGNMNYIKVYGENPSIKKEQDSITKWIQEELDKIKFKSRSYDFIESALKKRLSWIMLRPSPREKEFLTEANEKKTIRTLDVDFDVLDFYDVWFDTKAKSIFDTDFFVRKVKKLYDIKYNKEVYFNLDRVTTFNPADTDDDKRKDEHESMHSGYDSRPSSESEPMRAKPTDEVELLEYYGVYDFADGDMDDPDYKPDMKVVIFTLVNRSTLIRADEVSLDTRRKVLLFPIRPFRQAGSIIGKGIGQLTRKMAMELDEARSLRMQNFKTLIKLIFLYNRDSGIDLEDVYAGGGNAIGVEGDIRSALSTLPVPNLVGLANAMGASIQDDMQQVTGVADPLLNIYGATSATESRNIMEQAMFTMDTLVEKVALDLSDVISFIIILKLKFSKEAILMRYPKLQRFVDESALDIEDSINIDIALKDISQRRDSIRRQWTDAIGIIHPMVLQNGGNVKELLRRFLIDWGVDNAEEIIESESPQAIAATLLANPTLNQQVHDILAQMIQQQSGGSAPPAKATGEEEAANAEVQSL